LSSVRVLHVVATGSRRGAEVFASDLVRALARAGVAQRVAVLRGACAEVGFDAPVTMLDEAKEDAGATTLTASRRRLLRLRHAAAGWSPDVVQAHGGEATKHALASLVGTRTPVIYRRIGVAPPWLHRGPRRAAYAWLMRRAARVVTVGEQVRRETRELFGVPASSIVAIPNGVDADRVGTARGREEIRGSIGIPPGRQMLVSVGGITWEKNPLGHVRIAARVLNRRDAAHVWVGDGPMRQTLEHQAARSGLNGRFVLLGRRTDVGDLLAAADVLLFASRADGMEGMPAALIEAGMAGLAAAGFAVAGASEVIEDGLTGLLASPGDEEGLAGRVMELLEDDDRRRALGTAARERCLARFEIEPISRRYLALYDEVAER
jgi:glycosyltransferase involved in cell wall biosynthesis